MLGHAVLLINYCLSVRREGLLLDAPELDPYNFTAVNLVALMDGQSMSGYFIDLMAALIRDSVAPSRVLIGYSAWSGYTLRLPPPDDSSRPPAPTDLSEQLIKLLQFALRDRKIAKEQVGLHMWTRSVYNREG